MVSFMGLVFALYKHRKPTFYHAKKVTRVAAKFCTDQLHGFFFDQDFKFSFPCSYRFSVNFFFSCRKITHIIFDKMADFASDDQRKLTSVLLFATKWQFDTFGLSSVNKSLVNNLRFLDPQAEYVKITCAIVEEDRNIKDDQKKDAAKYKVELRGGIQPRGPRKKPIIEWLDQNIATYYPDLLRKKITISSSAMFLIWRMGH